MEPAFPLEDKRSGKRLTLVLRVAKLSCPTGEFLCILRDVSTGGIKLRLFHPLPESRPLEIDLGNGERHAVQLAWHRGDQAGFSFVAGPVALESLLADAGPFPRRGVRLRAELQVMIKGPGGATAGRLQDISLDGARIDCGIPFPLASRLQISCHRLPSIHGKVRWRMGQTHGIAFEHHFALDELARLLAPEDPHSAEIPAQMTAR
jgi:hypothetical protein